MNQNENNLQPFGIGRGLINFINKLESQMHYALAVLRRPFDFFVANAVRLIRLVPNTARFGCPVCHALVFLHGMYDFIIKSLAEQAIKPVTLGRSSRCGLREGPIGSTPTFKAEATEDAGDHAKIAENSFLLTSIGHDSNDLMTDERELSQVQDSADKILCSPKIQEENGEIEPNTTILPQARAPKKMVSINESIEVIKPIKKKRKKKSTEKLPSMEGEEEEPRPLKSILKVGSNVKDIETTS